jgi:hypothetical protein
MISAQEHHGYLHAVATAGKLMKVDGMCIFSSVLNALQQQ